MRRFMLAGVCVALMVGLGELATQVATARTGGPGAARVKAATWPTVGPQASGERVRVIQYLLNARGFRVAVTGVYGNSTVGAVKAFQRAIGLAADGRVVPATWARLVVTLRPGSRGDAVRALQHQLHYQYRVRSVNVDGVFGTRTQEVVKSFERGHSLRVNGIMSVAAWKVMEEGSLRAFEDFPVNAPVWIYAPPGTKLTFERTGNGNCARDIKNWDFSTPYGGWQFTGEYPLYIGKRDGICLWQKSKQQFLVTLHYPDGTSLSRLVNYEEIGFKAPIPAANPRVQTVCAYGNLPCTGGDDTQAEGHEVSPTLTIGTDQPHPEAASYRYKRAA